MAEELIYSIRLDGADDNVKALVSQKKALADLGKQLATNKATQKTLDDQLKAGTITEQQHNEATEKNILLQVQLETNIKKTRDAVRQNETAVKANSQATQGAGMSIKQLSSALSKAKSDYQNLSKEERESAKGQELKKHINDLDAEYKELHMSIGNTSVNVGNYQNAVNSLLPVMGGLGSQIQGVIGTLGQIKTALVSSKVAMQGATTATNGGSNALKLFKVALISTGIGAIVVVLGSLIGAFLSTQGGVDALSSALAPVKELFQTFIGFLQNTAFKVFDRLKKAIDNPKQAFIDLGKAIVENFTNRLNGIVQYAKGWGGVFVGTFKTIGLMLKKAMNDVPFLGAGLGKEALKKLDEDIAKAKDSVLKGTKDMADGAIAFTTGITDGTDKLMKLANDVSKESKIAVARAEQMQKLTIAIRKSEMTKTLDIERNNRLMEEQKLILENQLLPMVEQKNAGIEYLRLLNENIKRESDLINMKVKLSSLEQEANDTNDEQKKEHYDLIAEKEAMIAGLTGRKIEVQNKLNAIEKTAIQNLANEEEERKNKKIKDDEEANKTALEQTKSLAEEKLKQADFEQKKALILFQGTKDEEYAMELKHLEDMHKLKVENAKVTGQNVMDLNRDFELATFGLKQKKSVEDKKEKEEKDKTEAEKLKSKQQAQRDSAEQIASTLMDNEKRRLEQGTKREIEALTLKRQSGEISAEEFEAKRLEIDKKAFKKKQNMDVKEVLMNAIVGASKTTAQMGFVPAIPALIALAVKTAVQVAQIKSQKFEKGGNIIGKSHSQGGVMIEAEGGEAIINKKAVNPQTAPILSALNMAYGGNPIEALGSFRAPQVPQMAQTQTIEVVNVATDTAKIANRVKNLQNSRRF